uniref:Uncharacterized protein n=1 Tax=Rhizophora mucronata TaxID=61149 RepID=A0A2P2JH18_RHIMU
MNWFLLFLVFLDFFFFSPFRLFEILGVGYSWSPKKTGTDRRQE